MYAIFETGGKQYCVEKGDVIDIELIEDALDGKVQFDHVLFISDENSTKIGAPHLSNCSVKGLLVEEVKGPKVVAFKYKQRKRIRRKVGHRQRYSRVEITDIID